MKSELKLFEFELNLKGLDYFSTNKGNLLSDRFERFAYGIQMYVALDTNKIDLLHAAYAMYAS